MNVGQAMADAIAAVPYAASVKIGLQFKRRFWEQDEAIYGGISYTDLPIDTISYPSHGYHDGGKAVLLGAYTFGANAMKFTAMSPRQRIRAAVEQGSQIHPQYPAEFDNGVSVAWHRSPFTLGCFGLWTESRARTALRQSLPDRWPHRAGRRACLVFAGVAGRRGDLGTRCH